MTMPKIVNDVIKSYKKTKLKPQRSVWCMNKEACGLGALLCAKTGSKKSQKLEDEAIKLLGKEYVNGFIGGFDTFTKLKSINDVPYYDNGTEAQRGYWHGYLTAQKVLPK